MQITITVNAAMNGDGHFFIGLSINAFVDDIEWQIKRTSFLPHFAFDSTLLSIFPFVLLYVFSII